MGPGTHGDRQGPSTPPSEARRRRRAARRTTSPRRPLRFPLIQQRAPGAAAAGARPGERRAAESRPAQRKGRPGVRRRARPGRQSRPAAAGAATRTHPPEHPGAPKLPAHEGGRRRGAAGGEVGQRRSTTICCGAGCAEHATKRASRPARAPSRRAGPAGARPTGPNIPPHQAHACGAPTAKRGRSRPRVLGHSSYGSQTHPASV